MSIVNVIGEESHDSVDSSDYIDDKLMEFKSEYYLPDGIETGLDSTGEGYYYCSDKDLKNVLKFYDVVSATDFLKIKPIWAQCPFYRINKVGYKYVDRNDVDSLRRYLKQYHPGKINLKEGESLDTVDKIWVYPDGYFSYRKGKEKRNLSPNCTNLKDGGRCPGMEDGTCAFNHFVDPFSKVSSKPCRFDIDQKKACLPCGAPRMRIRSMCPEVNCPYDHSVDRLDNVNNLRTLKTTFFNNNLSENVVMEKYYEFAFKYLNQRLDEKPNYGFSTPPRTERGSPSPVIVSPGDNVTTDDDDMSVSEEDQSVEIGTPLMRNLYDSFSLEERESQPNSFDYKSTVFQTVPGAVEECLLGDSNNTRTVREDSSGNECDSGCSTDSEEESSSKKRSDSKKRSVSNVMFISIDSISNNYSLSKKSGGDAKSPKFPHNDTREEDSKTPNIELFDRCLFFDLINKPYKIDNDRNCMENG